MTERSKESHTLLQLHYWHLRTEAIYFFAAGSTAIEDSYPIDHADPGAAIAELNDLLNRLKALTAGLPMPDAT